MDAAHHAPPSSFGVDAVLLAALRRLLRARSEEEVVGVLIEAVRELGASVVPEAARGHSTLGIDVSLGIGDPLLVSVPDQATHARVQNLVPPLLDDARLVLARLHAGSNGDDDATDPLTGLANWTTAMRSLSRLGSGDAVAVLEIERLEQVNDHYGTEVGDMVLVAFARVLRRVARSADSVGRVGGKSFIWLLGGSGLPGAETALARLHTVWEAERPMAVTYAAGLALVTTTGPTEAYMLADLVLQEAQRSGVGHTRVSR